jgi:hypothetical protein
MEKDTEVAFSGENTIKEILQLIRYDIPLLIVGKSSIGKSYTIIDITEKWRMPNQILYIGSEKAENIEGIPKLTQRDVSKEQLEYLQPYWFPNGAVITESVRNGLEIYKKLIKQWSPSGNLARQVVTKKFSPTYANLNAILNALSYVKVTHNDLQPNGTYQLDLNLISKSDDNVKNNDVTLNAKPFKFTVHPEKIVQTSEDGKSTANRTNDNVTVSEYYQNDLRDLSMFLTTALGYGNYWLILDEIDKVDELDKDKFAPLLHIVRERTLKNFRMVEINNGDGLNIPFSVNGVNYGGIIGTIETDLKNNQSILDTRVIAVANESKNIDQNNDALFRRFVQVIVEEVMIWRKTNISQEQDRISKCVSATEETIGATTKIGEELLARLDDINLQWKYNFFPKILNVNDQNNFFVDNYYAEYAGKTQHKTIAMQATALFKVLKDNYQVEGQDLPAMLFSCLGNTIQDETSGDGALVDEEVKLSKTGVLDELVKNYGIKEGSDSYALEKMTAFDKIGSGDITNKLASWSKEILQSIEMSLIRDGKWQPIMDDDGEPLYKFFIPRMIHVYYGKILNADKKEIGYDMANAMIHNFQKFFGELVNKYSDEIKDIQLDKVATSELFKEDFLGAKPLYGTKGFSGSAVGGLAVKLQDDKIKFMSEDLVSIAQGVNQQIRADKGAGATISSAMLWIRKNNKDLYEEADIKAQTSDAIKQFVLKLLGKK